MDLGHVDGSAISSAQRNEMTREREDDILFGRDEESSGSGSSESESDEEEVMRDRALGQDAMRQEEKGEQQSSSSALLWSQAKVEPMIVEYEDWEELVEAAPLTGGSKNAEGMRPFSSLGRAGNFLFFGKADPQRPTDVWTVRKSLERLFENGTLTLAKIQDYEDAFVKFQRQDMAMKKARLDAYLRRYFVVEAEDRLPDALDMVLAAVVINTKYFLSLLGSYVKRLKERPLKAAPKQVATTQADVDRAKQALLLEQPPELFASSSAPISSKGTQQNIARAIYQPTLSLWEDAFEGERPETGHKNKVKLPSMLDNTKNFIFLFRSHPELYTSEREFYDSMDRWLDDDFLNLDPPVISKFLERVQAARMERNPAMPVFHYLKRHFDLDSDEAIRVITPEYVDKLWANTEAMARRLEYYLAHQLERWSAFKSGGDKGRVQYFPPSNGPLLFSNGQSVSRARAGPRTSVYFQQYFGADWEKFMVDPSNRVLGGTREVFKRLPLPERFASAKEQGNFVFLWRDWPEYDGLSFASLAAALRAKDTRPSYQEISFFLTQFSKEVRESMGKYAFEYLKLHYVFDVRSLSDPRNMAYIHQLIANTHEIIKLLQILYSEQVRIDVVDSQKKTRSTTIPLYDRLAGIGVVARNGAPVPAASPFHDHHLYSKARLEVRVLEFDSWAELIEGLSYTFPNQSSLAPTRDIERHLDARNSFLFALKATPAILSGESTIFGALARLDAQGKIRGEDVRNYIQDLAVFLLGPDAANGATSGPETIGIIRSILREHLANVLGERSMNTFNLYARRHYVLEAATDAELGAIDWHGLVSVFWRNTERFFNKLLEYYEPGLRFSPSNGMGHGDDDGDSFVDAPITSDGHLFSARNGAARYRLQDEASLNIALSDQSKRLGPKDNVPGDTEQWERSGRGERMAYITYRPREKENVVKRVVNKLSFNRVRLEPHEILFPTFYDQSYSWIWFGEGRFGVLPERIIERLPRLPSIGRYAEGDQITRKLRELRDMFSDLAQRNDLVIIPSFGGPAGQDRFIWVAGHAAY